MTGRTHDTHQMQSYKPIKIVVLISILILSCAVYLRVSGEQPLLGRIQNHRLSAIPNVGPATTLYLPIMNVTAISRPYNVFGAETYLTPQAELDKLNQTDAHWVHGIFVHWADIEPSVGARDWDAMASDEQKIITAAENQFSTIVLVRKTPSWAQKYPGVECGAILPDRYDEFAAFMSDLVERYSQYPYNVRYWEIWNEPDPAPHEVTPTSLIGCWGDVDDSFGYGGGAYADMLKQVYPAIKSADPDAQVLIGGLLMDCNPNLYLECESSWFLRGILDNGGGPYFDGVAFHSYDYYFNSLGSYGNGNWLSGWSSTGPVISTKADFLRAILSDYGYPGKYLINLESGLLCDPEWEGVSCGSTFETTKAYYLAQAYAMTIGEDLFGNSWYGLSIDFQGPVNNRNSALLDDDLNPLPAYYTFQFASSILTGATSDRDLTEFTNVMGYVFDREGTEVWVLWSKDGDPHSITLPGTPSAVYQIGTDGMPDSLAPSTSLNVTLAPIFLEW